MTTTSTRRAILAGISTVPATSVPTFGASNAPDPIYAAIAAHRRAVATRHAAGDDVKTIMRADDMMDETTRTLADIRPTTIAGVIAFLSYIAECLGDDGVGWQFPGDTRLQVLIRAAAAALERLT